VVVATLGGESLLKTIECLNSSSVIPNKILICIPANYFYETKDLHFNNIEIIQTQSKGQVFQRSEGFKKAMCEFVMQIDDDIKRLH